MENSFSETQEVSPEHEEEIFFKGDWVLKQVAQRGWGACFSIWRMNGKDTRVFE